MKFIIMGAGSISTCLAEKLSKCYVCEIYLISRKNGVCFFPSGRILAPFEDWPKYAEGASAAFIAIPTVDDGSIELGYFQKLLGEIHVPYVITCAKGALAEHRKELLPFLPRIGYSAAVGGGLGMVPNLRYFVARKNVSEIHVVANGTLNFITDEVSRGMSYEQAASYAGRFNYADPTEPGSDAMDVVTNEIQNDVLRKTVILWDDLGFGGVSFKPRELGLSNLKVNAKELLKSPDARYIVSICKAKLLTHTRRVFMLMCHTPKGGGFFRYAGQDDEWIIHGGFVPRDLHPCFEYLDWTGANNSFVAVTTGPDGEDDGVYSGRGPGAGPNPTASAMIGDFNLLAKNG